MLSSHSLFDISVFLPPQLAALEAQQAHLATRVAQEQHACRMFAAQISGLHTTLQERELCSKAESAQLEVCCLSRFAGDTLPVLAARCLSAADL